MFHTEPFQLPKLLSREYHCCCDTDETWPLTLLSAMKPPLAKPLLAGARSIPPCTSIRRNGPAWATAQRSLPADGVIAMFSADRQKFWVALPVPSKESTVTSLLFSWTELGFCPRPWTDT